MTLSQELRRERVTSDESRYHRSPFAEAQSKPVTSHRISILLRMLL